MKITDRLASFEDTQLDADARAMWEEDAPANLSWDRLDATIKEEYRRIARAARGCACCGERFVSGGSGAFVSIACEPCLAAGCTTRECRKPEPLGEPLPALDLAEISDGFDALLGRATETEYSR